MKKYIVLMLFIFAGLCSRSQRSRDIPLLMEKLSQSKEDTSKINLQLKLGSYYMFKYGLANNLDSATAFFNQALQLSIKLHETDLQYKTLEKMAYCSSLADDKEGSKQGYLRVIAYYHQTGDFMKEAQAWVYLAERYHYNESQYLDTTISYYRQARSLYLQNNQPIEAAEALADIANRRIDFKQFDVAENELQEVLAQYKAAGYKKLQPTYQYLYRLQYNKGNYYRALAYCMESIKRMGIEKDTINSIAYYRLAAECNMAVKKYEQAIEWLHKALAIEESNTSLKSLLARSLLALNRIEEARMILNDLGKEQPKGVYNDRINVNWVFALYHHKLNNNELAIRYYLKTMEVIDGPSRIEQHHNTWYVMCNNGIAEVYLRANQPQKAEKYLHNTALIFKNARTSLDPALLADFYGHQYKYDVATGHYATAVKNLERRVTLQDSLFTADKDKQLAELNIQYETTQKEQSIKNLQSQGTAQQAKTEKANLQRNITIVGILVMIVVSLLFYRNYQQKKAANTIITYKNGQLQHLLTEKEWLLKEVHHRVKNNLHTVIGLLESQATYLRDDALKANEISKHRIYAMSLIHQQLYKTDDIKSIDMAVFLPELLDYLSESFGTERKIRFNRAIEPIKLGVAQAIPIALIVNESITNAIKYAFPGEKRGNINITMHQSGETISLVIADDGIGLDPAIIKAETNSMGMKLLKGLTDDIDGEINIANENGTTIRISFKPDPLNEFNSLSVATTT